MSALRELLKRPHTWLGVTALGFVAAVADVRREPGSQLLGSGYVACVRMYQVVGRPLLRGHIRCRYTPTCSDYSISAVQQHGLVRGLVLTKRRIESCTPAVPRGTVDLVPELKRRAYGNLAEEAAQQPVAADGAAPCR
jgi:putative membrane protein insertion efficiency factor